VGYLFNYLPIITLFSQEKKLLIKQITQEKEKTSSNEKMKLKKGAKHYFIQ